MEKNKRRRERGHDTLLSDDASQAQDWILDEGLTYDLIGEAMDINEVIEPRRSNRMRELYEEEFDSDSEEEEVDEDVEYESDGVKIIEKHYAHDKDFEDSEE